MAQLNYCSRSPDFRNLPQKPSLIRVTGDLWHDPRSPFFTYLPPFGVAVTAYSSSAWNVVQSLCSRVTVAPPAYVKKIKKVGLPFSDLAYEYVHRLFGAELRRVEEKFARKYRRMFSRVGS